MHSVLGRLRHDHQNSSPHKLTSIVYIYIYLYINIHRRINIYTCTTFTSVLFLMQRIAFCHIYTVNNKHPHVNLLEVYHLSHLTQLDQGSQVEMCIGVHETLRTHGSSETNMFRRKGGSWWPAFGEGWG